MKKLKIDAKPGTKPFKVGAGFEFEKAGNGGFESLHSSRQSYLHNEIIKSLTLMMSKIMSARLNYQFGSRVVSPS